MRALLIVLAMVCTHAGCAQPMATRPFSVERSRPPAQRDNRNPEANRSRAAVPSRQEGVESPSASGGQQPEARVSPATPTGTTGREAAEAVTDDGSATATGGSAVTESKDEEAPISYSVAVDHPSSSRRGLAAGIALGTGVIAVALWVLSRRFVK
jgi:hypothetical protein